MNQRFNLQRIQWLLRKDWIEYKKSIFYALGAFLVALIPFIWISTRSAGMNLVNKQVAFYILGMWGSILYFYRYASMQVHFPKGVYWTLPASTEEKYGVLLLEGVLVMLTFSLLFWLSIGIWGLLFPDYQMADWKIIYLPVAKTTLFGLLASLLFYAYLRFKKHAFAIWLCALAAVAGGFIGIVYLCGRYLRGMMERIVDFISEHDAISSVFRFIGEYISVVWVLLTVWVLYRAYLTFKRKEVR